MAGKSGNFFTEKEENRKRGHRPIVWPVFVLALTAMLAFGGCGKKNQGPPGETAGVAAESLEAQSEERLEASLEGTPEPGTAIGENAGADSGADSTPDAGTDAGADSTADIGTDSGADSKPDTGTDSGADSKADTGTDIGADSKTASGADKITDDTEKSSDEKAPDVTPGDPGVDNPKTEHDSPENSNVTTVSDNGKETQNTSDLEAGDNSVGSDVIEENEPQIDRDGTYTSRDEVALYIHTYGELPANFITKKEAQKLGWEGGPLEKYAPGMSIGGDRFGNYEGLLPQKNGRVYHECDIDTKGARSRGAKRIVYSSDGLIYYTEDHYESFVLLYGDE